MIACSKGTKEHESIVAIDVASKHVHLGFLLIGAQNGEPAMRRQLNDDGPWVDIPPSGDPIDVSLVIQDESGKTVERPIADYVTRTTVAGDTKPDQPFPDSFLFAGSHLIENGSNTHYLADLQGAVISVSTFGDEVLCLSGTNSKNNGALDWAANPETLPKAGTRVTLRLRA